MHWQTRRFLVDLTSPRVMGIVNVTPDSFYDGGSHFDAAAALRHCERLVADGADILDIGGESTRPGAMPLTVEMELARVLPVVAGAVTLGVPVSVDTSEPEVMRRALELGADIINDVRALSRPGAVECLAADPTAGVCLMHMRGTPATMHRSSDYADVVAEVGAFLNSRALALQALQIGPDRIVIDPGIGFGKSAPDNIELTAQLPQLVRRGWPVLVGWSRKSTLGALVGRGVDDRLPASIAAALAAVHKGASIVRVHDVAATVDAIKVWRALQ